MSGGIGDFNVSMGQSPSGGSQNGQPRSESKPRKPRNFSEGNPHYIVMMKKGWEQSGPLRFHNGFLDDLRTRFRLTAKVPLPQMPNFFPAGAEGEMTFEGRNVLHLDSALKEQTFFSHLEQLRDLVQRVAERKAAFPEFISGLNAISIPAAWRNEIVNGLFDHADPPPIISTEPKSPANTSEIDRLMDMINQDTSGGSKLSPHLGRFLDEVGRDSTGFTLRDGAAKQLHKDLAQTLDFLRGSMLQNGSLAEALAFLSSLQRLAKTAKGRDRQTIHLWSDIPVDPMSLLVGENADAGADFAVAIVLPDPKDRDPAFLHRLANLAAALDCPLLLQWPDEAVSPNGSLQALSDASVGASTFLFSGGVASRVEGENCVFRPAALAFLEGLVAAKETVDFYAHRSLVLEDQDLVTEKGQARASDRLLDQSQVDALSAKRINRVNGARNRSTASFPLLTAWEGA
jgi:hypothetical protein